MRRIEKLERRRIDDSPMVRASLSQEVYKSIKDSESVRYAIGAMQPIDPDYTQNTYDQGNRVKSQLQQRLAIDCDYEYQGSVTTDTHIKARSDIDLLVVRKGWWWVDPPQESKSPYQGDPKQDMRDLRKQSASALSAAFPQATVDTSKSTAIKISGGSLSRDVDVVPASWLDTNDYARTSEKVYRGVKVFNAETGDFAANTPFLHKRRIEERDQRTNGGLRRAIRLMKSLMYDSDGRVDMSSYNIAGIAWNIPEGDLIPQRPKELAILEACCNYCERIGNEPNLRDAVRVPDGHRTVFGGSAGATAQQLDALTKELVSLRSDILTENARSFRALAEARVDYPSPGARMW